MEGEDLYLPTAPNKLVRGIQVDSGVPLQSAAKVPIMITFNVTDRDGDHNDIKPQACIFKVWTFSMFFCLWIRTPTMVLRRISEIYSIPFTNHWKLSLNSCWLNFY